MAFNVRSAAEHELFGSANVAFDSAIDLRDRHVDHRLCYLRASADDECSIFRRHVSGEVAVDTQHRFEANFAREIHHVAYEAEPIIFIDIGPLTINECCHFIASECRGRKEI